MTSKKGPTIFADALRTILDAPRFVFVLAIVLFTFDLGLCVANHLKPISALEGLVLVSCVALFRALMRAWLRPGYLRSLSAMQTGDELGVDSALPPLGAFLGTFIVNMLTDLITLASMVAGAIPGLVLVLVAADRGHDEMVFPALGLAAFGSIATYLYAWLAVRFGEYALALEGYGPRRALHRVWNLARGRRLELLRVQLFATGVELGGLFAGMACFGIGLLLSVPTARVIGDHAHVAMYRRLIRSERDVVFDGAATATTAVVGEVVGGRSARGAA